jgi:ABC-type transporter lipoprotein component MlaA
MIVHDVIRPFAYNMCSSEFATNSALQHHESQCRQTIDGRSFTSPLGLEGLLNSLESSDPQEAVFDQ